jgi:hypothetical protein
MVIAHNFDLHGLIIKKKTILMVSGITHVSLQDLIKPMFDFIHEYFGNISGFK